jgi:hypothetical protein
VGVVGVFGEQVLSQPGGTVEPQPASHGRLMDAPTVAAPVRRKLRLDLSCGSNGDEGKWYLQIMYCHTAM